MGRHHPLLPLSILALLLTGCLSHRNRPSDPAANETPEVPADAQAAAPNAEAEPAAEAKTPETPPAETAAGDESAPADSPAPHPDGYSWDELARLASSRADKAKIYLLKAAARRFKTSNDTLWKDPQLRVGHSWDEGRSNTPAHPDWQDNDIDPRSWEHSHGHSDTLALRLPIANPFVNRWIRKQGESEARSLEARAQEEAYAIYCEVKMLCMEADILRRELELIAQIAPLNDELQAYREEQVQAGVLRSPLSLIQAERAREELRADKAAKQIERQQILRQIALLSGVPLDELKIQPLPPVPSAERLPDAPSLTDLALARRPDLQSALYDQAAAGHGVKLAQAAHIPWIDFIEGTYKNDDSFSRSYEGAVSNFERTADDKEEWQVRMGISIPIFTWMGDTVQQSKLISAAADARVQGLYATIRDEICGSLEDFQFADMEHRRLEAASEAFCEKIEARISAFEKDRMGLKEETIRSRREMLVYRKICLKVEREWLRQYLLLESVSGGPLPEEPPPQSA
ncbi:MAG: TolC family protein [Kiritimatiellae bacterium]|nr:TolC family protein [Kiritimatiellia bacterium]